MFYGLEQLGCFQMPTLRFQHCRWFFSTQNFFMNLWHLCIYTIVITLYCFVYVCVYIFCPCSCVRYPQLKSIYCGMVQLVVFRLPEYLYYLQHCIDGTFNLRLPPMHAIVIIPRCFVFCICFSINFMFYGLEQLDCFRMPTLRFQHWVFSTHNFFMNLWHLIYDCYNFVVFCVYKFEHLWFRCVCGIYFALVLVLEKMHV
jgi:hypothetical protein